jgi:hypothetical protein
MIPASHIAKDERLAGKSLGWRRWPLIGFALISGVAIALLALRFIQQIGIDVPVWEHWDFLPTLGESYAGGPWLRSVFQPFFGHMVAVPMLLFIGFSRVNGWNLMFEMYWGWLLVVATCLVFVRWVRELRLPLSIKVLFFVCLALLLFGLRSSELTFNGLNSGVFLAYFLIVATFELAREPKSSWPRFIAAAVCGLLATWSWGAGILVWPAGGLLVLHHERARWGRLASWGAVALVALSPFVLFKVEEHAVAAHHDLTRVPRWFMNVVSAPFSFDSSLLPAALVLPLGLVAVWVVGKRALRARGLSPELLPWAALLLHAVLTILLILVVRSPTPGFLPTASRYAFVAAFLVVSVLGLGLLALREVTEKASPRLRQGGWVAAALVLLLAGGVSANKSYEMYGMLCSWQPVRTSLDAFMRRAPQYATEGQFLGVVQNRSELVLPGLAVMKRWHLGPYRSASASAAPLPLEAWVAQGSQAEDLELGGVSSKTTPEGHLEVFGWALDRQGMRPAEFVVASAEGKILEQALTEMAASSLPAGADPWHNVYGWRLLIPEQKLRSLAEPQRLELVALSRDGRTRRLALRLPEGLGVAVDSQ